MTATLGLEQVHKILSAWTGIPVDKIATRAMTDEDFVRLREALDERVVGQSGAITTVVQALRRRFQLPDASDSRKPIFTAVFAGPSGVGKTQLSRTLAEKFFPGEGKSLTIIDLSEFNDEHTMSRLVGAPPGYVGYGTGGELTNALRSMPTGVLVFDEVEKAHPAILTKILLPLMGEGLVHDMNSGKALSASNHIVILTTNLGTNPSSGRRAGFDAGQEASQKASAMVAIRSEFPREVLGRIDEVIVFNRLDDPAIRGIWDMETEGLRRRLKEREDELNLDVRDEAVEVLLRKVNGSSVKDMGAREVQRVFRREVEDRMLQLLDSASGNTEPFEGVAVDLNDEGRVRFRFVQAGRS